MKTGRDLADLESLVIICTRNRPHELDSCLMHVFADRPGQAVLIVDASDSNGVADVSASWKEKGQPVERMVAPRVGLARQRNDGLDYALAAYPAKIIHFIDDDTEVQSGYFDAIEERFNRKPELLGVSGVDQDRTGRGAEPIRRFFLLDGPAQRVLVSGSTSRYVVGNTLPNRVDWLPGCSMSYRREAFMLERFDDRLERASMGEDRDLSFRLSKHGPLYVEPRALYIHRQSPVERTALRPVFREFVPIQWRWVTEQRTRGLRRWAMVWSFLGLFVLSMVTAIIRRRSADVQVCVGMIQGTVDLIRAMPSI